MERYLWYCQYCWIFWIYHWRSKDCWRFWDYGTSISLDGEFLTIDERGFFWYLICVGFYFTRMWWWILSHMWRHYYFTILHFDQCPLCKFSSYCWNGNPIGWPQFVPIELRTKIHASKGENYASRWVSIFIQTKSEFQTLLLRQISMNPQSWTMTLVLWDSKARLLSRNLSIPCVCHHWEKLDLAPLHMEMEIQPHWIPLDCKLLAKMPLLSGGVW